MNKYMNTQRVKKIGRESKKVVKTIGGTASKLAYPKQLLNTMKQPNNYYNMVKKNLKISRNRSEKFKAGGSGGNKPTPPMGGGAMPAPKPPMGGGKPSHKPSHKPPVVINKNYYGGGYSSGGYWDRPSWGWGYDYPVYVPVEVPVEVPVPVETPKTDDESKNQSKMLRKQEKMLMRNNNLMTFVLLALVGGGLIYLFGQKK